MVVAASGALYTDAFFEEGEGDVTAFVPVSGEGDRVVELAASTFAVLTYTGSFADLDQAYGVLGTAVAERGIGGAGPIREHYLTDTVTEVCWPVTAGAAHERPGTGSSRDVPGAALADRGLAWCHVSTRCSVVRWWNEGGWRNRSSR